jgi:hypothetical protein
MGIVPMLILLIAIGFVLYLVRGQIQGTMYRIIVALVVLFVVFWLLDAFGIVQLPAAFRVRQEIRR